MTPEGYALVSARFLAFWATAPHLGLLTQARFVRLLLALTFSCAIAPALCDLHPWLLEPITAKRVLVELGFGSAMGFVVRCAFLPVYHLGETISAQSALSNVLTPHMQEQVSPVTKVLIAMATLSLWSDGFLQLMVRGFWHSYTLDGSGASFENFGPFVLKILSEGSKVTLALSAPFLLLSLALSLTLGFVGRLMPYLQIFFLSQPLSILIGLTLFGVNLHVLGHILLKNVAQSWLWTAA